MQSMGEAPPKTAQLGPVPCRTPETRRLYPQETEPVAGHRRLLRKPSLSVSFDHLVGAGEERGRDRQAQVFRGYAVEHKLETASFYDRQFARSRPLQDAIDVPGSLPEVLPNVAAVRHQATCENVRRVGVHHWNPSFARKL